jgi:hypothetical protein
MGDGEGAVEDVERLLADLLVRADEDRGIERLGQGANPLEDLGSIGLLSRTMMPMEDTASSSQSAA